eukprot:XP_014031240.1 PREDICTED: retinitis pigmentosa 1-like 1 protein isoform X3 [Salmo salar]
MTSSPATQRSTPRLMTATTYIIATQDKDTITGTQIQREMGVMKNEKDMEEVGEQKEDKMEIDNKDGEDLAGDAGQREASVRQGESKSQTEEVADSQTGEDEELAKSEGEVSESQAEGEVSESQAEGEVSESQAEGEVSESQAEGEVSESQAEGEVSESQAEGEVSGSQAEGEVSESQAEGEVSGSQAEGEVSESQAEGEVSESQAEGEVSGSQAEGEVSGSQAEGEVSGSQAEGEEEEMTESQTEGEVSGSQAEGEVSGSQAEGEVSGSQAEGEVSGSQAEGEVSGSQAEGEVSGSQAEGEEEEMTESQTEDVADEGGQVVEEGQEKGLTSQSLAHNAMHISRRAYCSEGGVKVAGVMEGGRGYKSMGAELHPTETGESGWAGRRSEGDTAGEWHSGPVVGASESAHTRTVTLGSAPPSPLPQEDEQELEGLSRTGTSLGNEEMENSMPPLEITFEPENNAPHSTISSLHPITAQSPADHEEDWDDVEEGDGIQSEELSMKTPAFVREKRNALPIDPLATPTILKDLQPSFSAGAAAAVKPKAVRGKRAGSAKKDPGLSKSYIMSVFKHFAKTKVSTDVYPVLKEIMELYFDRLADDLEMFAAHAKRKTIEVEDVELLMRRQGFVTDSMPVNVLIEKYLPMESQKLLIPVANSGNYVIPKPRRK